MTKRKYFIGVSLWIKNGYLAVIEKSENGYKIIDLKTTNKGINSLRELIDSCNYQADESVVVGTSKLIDKLAEKRNHHGESFFDKVTLDKQELDKDTIDCLLENVAVGNLEVSESIDGYLKNIPSDAPPTLGDPKICSLALANKGMSYVGFEWMLDL